MTIQALGEERYAQLLALLTACDLPTGDLAEVRPHFLGEHDSAGLVGVVGIERHGGVGLLRSLAVRAGARGSGVGSRLADAAEAWAASHGIRQLYLLTTTAERFFARRGYQVRPRDQVDPAIQRTTEFTSACPASATVMWCELA
ncbi:MAG TPA: arsenic resistance N-acetyltransferase ArsN2 [Gemmatimonadales bacterium]|nr:arsenic resistance N-acetyltransferase ArsN2 [Gemmatimonadales bacterium]